MPTYHFLCECGDEGDVTVHHATTSLPCACGGEAKKQFTPPGRGQFMFRVGFQYTRSQFTKDRARAKWSGWKAQ